LLREQIAVPPHARPLIVVVIVVAVVDDVDSFQIFSTFL
jgi:hypothetical protein